MPIRAKKLAAQSETPADTRNSEVSVAQSLEQFATWLRQRETGISLLTVRGYLADVDKFVGWFRISSAEAFTLKAVTPVDVRNYKSHLQTVSAFKPATINRRLAALRTFFTWAEGEQLVMDMPVRVRNVEELPTAPRSLDARAFSKFVRAAQQIGDKRMVAIVQLLGHTGLRVSELCSLYLTDLVISDRKGRVIVRSGKGSRYREVPLNLDVRRALKMYLASRPAVADQHVFIGQRLNGLTNSGVQAVIRKVAQYAGMEGVSPHTLRHTFGKGLIDQGVDLVTVKTLMGHKRLDSTAHYTQPSVSDLEGAVARLATEEE